jgi:hypothetical protein
MVVFSTVSQRAAICSSAYKEVSSVLVLKQSRNNIHGLPTLRCRIGKAWTDVYPLLAERDFNQRRREDKVVVSLDIGRRDVLHLLVTRVWRAACVWPTTTEYANINYPWNIPKERVPLHGHRTNPPRSAASRRFFALLWST